MNSNLINILKKCQTFKNSVQDYGEEKSIDCPICSKNYKNKSSLFYHLRNHCQILKYFEAQDQTLINQILFPNNNIPDKKPFSTKIYEEIIADKLNQVIVYLFNCLFI